MAKQYVIVMARIEVEIDDTRLVSANVRHEVEARVSGAYPAGMQLVRTSTQVQSDGRYRQGSL